MSACISDALAQLRKAHPQWGWAVAGEEIVGKQGAAYMTLTQVGAAWRALLVSGVSDWTGYDDTPLGAFNRARDNAGGRW